MAELALVRRFQRERRAQRSQSEHNPGPRPPGTRASACLIRLPRDEPGRAHEEVAGSISTRSGLRGSDHVPCPRGKALRAAVKFTPMARHPFVMSHGPPRGTREPRPTQALDRLPAATAVLWEPVRRRTRCRCPPCRSFFSVRTGTPMAPSKPSARAGSHHPPELDELEVRLLLETAQSHGSFPAGSMFHSHAHPGGVARRD